MTGTALRGSLPADTAQLRALLDRRFAQSADVPRRFFAVHAEAVSQTCLAMARRFEQGGRLLVFGEGAQASDAEHVAVEFVHPVLVGKRALPAIALPGSQGSLIPHLGALARSGDIAMAIDADGEGQGAALGLARARSLGLLTIALVGGDGGAIHREGGVDHLFVVPSDDPLVVQETHETLYHVLWELVHLFFEHRVTG